MKLWGIGAGDESRTRDLRLGKPALYQLSYSRSEKNNSSPDLCRYRSIPIIDPLALTHDENRYSGTVPMVLYGTS
jgi:hypothetical protein